MRSALLFGLLGIYLALMVAVEVTSKPDIHNAPGAGSSPTEFYMRKSLE